MTAGRDASGKFVKGHKLAKKMGAGRKALPVEIRNIEAFNGIVTPKEFAKATRAVLKMAQDGDVRAWQALAKYALGLPDTYINMRNDVQITTVMTVENWREEARKRRESVEVIDVNSDGSVRHPGEQQVLDDGGDVQVAGEDGEL